MEERTYTVEKWIKELPRSRVVYPQNKRDRLMYWCFRAYTPFHKPVRATSLALGLLKHEGRQDFLLGTLDPKHSMRDFVAFLVEHGFGNHFIAWREENELVSLRKAVGFKYQYHVRIFTDGEVRCHYEYTPECHPILHIREIGVEDRTEEFKTLIQDWIV